MRPFRLPRAALLVACLIALLPACTAPAPRGAERDTAEGTVRFASYDFAENQTLVEVYAQAARRVGLPVSVQHGVGTREVVQPALQQGVVDVVVDYLGTALEFARPGRPRTERTPEELHAALVEALGPSGATVLAPAAAEDQNGFAVTETFADDGRLKRLSDLEPIARNLVFGGPPECPHRPFCLPGLREVYGLEFGSVRSMPSRAATVEALLAGEIHVGLLETTDARLAEAPLVLLPDDRSLQPRENVVPLVRTETLDRFGEPLRTALDEVSARLTTADLVELNGAVDLDGLSPAEAAARWWAAG